MTVAAPGSKDDVQLKRELGLFGGISFIVGTMIGSGIFASPAGEIYCITFSLQYLLNWPAMWFQVLWKLLGVLV